jgi:aryl-alcohol dehydrogenase-like predicted oxidoreductase
MHLTIGTAQFGFKYGLDKIKISDKEILKIKKIISKNKIKYWDTAINYGRSEKILGNLKIEKKIITKITLPKKKVKNLEKWFENTLRKSLKRLKVKSLYGLLIHNTSDILFDNKKFLNLILEYKKKKLVSKIGISVYETQEIEKVLKFWKPDIIQIPVNIFDQRFIKNNFLKTLKKKKIEIYARSCFLLGILLKDTLCMGNDKSKKIFKKFLAWCKKNKIDQLTTCLHFIKKIKDINSLVVGFDNALQLKEIISAFNTKLIIVPNKFSNNEKKLIDPRKWSYN